MSSKPHTGMQLPAELQLSDDKYIRLRNETARSTIRGITAGRGHPRRALHQSSRWSKGSKRNMRARTTRRVRIEPPVVEIEDVHAAGSCDARVVAAPGCPGRHPPGP